MPAAAVTLLQSRGDVMELLELKREVDLIVPRGGREFVEHIRLTAKCPCSGMVKGFATYTWTELRTFRWRTR